MKKTDPNLQDLYQAILQLKNLEECERFLADLCTPAELLSMADRWRAAQLLSQGMPYRSIYEKTGVSTATVTRVARALTYGEGGYRMILDRKKGGPLDPSPKLKGNFPMRENGRLRIAIQKSGRLSEKSVALFSKCGLDFDFRKDRLLHECKEFPIDLMLVRDDDIPEYVADGVCDLGVVGENVIRERLLAAPGDKAASIETVMKLGFGSCRLSLAMPESAAFTGPRDLAGSASRPPTPTASPSTWRVSASKPKLSSFRARWRSPRASRSPTRSATWFRPGARCAPTVLKRSR